MSSATVTSEQFTEAAEAFVKISDKICDGWKLHLDHSDSTRSYIRKDTFISYQERDVPVLLKAEFVIFYNVSYGVPAFSFNIWNSCGVLLTLQQISEMSFIKMDMKEFYSVITQQEHPVLGRPYFVVHPCHTAALLAPLATHTRNVIVTFLALITPLIKLNLPFEYAL